jgi:DNA-binding HxlR family transcriptional regulator
LAVRYLQEVKDSILVTLSQRGSMHWTRLFTAVRELHHKMAIETFNICIKDLLSSKFIDRIQVLEKGKKVDYFLTQKGKQYLRLLLDHESGAKTRVSEKKERRKMLLLLLFLFRNPYDNIYRSEQEFQDLLLRNNISEREIIRKIPDKEFKDGKTITTTHLESDSGIYVWRTDTLDERKNPPETTRVYLFKVPGLSKSDILESRNKPAFWHINFTENEIEGLFDSLRNEKDPMFRVVAFDHDGEPRYDVSNELLRELLDTCYKIKNFAEFLTQQIWKYLRKPTDDERKWLELVGGKQHAEKLCRILYEKRKHLKNDRQQVKGIEEEMKVCFNKLNKLMLIIKKNYANIIEKYQFPLDGLMEIIYPKFLQQFFVQQ